MGNFLRKYGINSEKSDHLFQNYVERFVDLKKRNLIQLTVYTKNTGNALVI